MPKGEPYIPETITVHLGRPDADAMNVEEIGRASCRERV